jgi:hypothetical protein
MFLEQRSVPAVIEEATIQKGWSLWGFFGMSRAATPEQHGTPTANQGMSVPSLSDDPRFKEAP